MALCARVGSWKSVTLPCVIVVLLLVVQCPASAQASVKHPKRPRRLSFNVHEFRGNSPNSTMTILTQSGLGFFAVVNNRVTEGLLSTSKYLGQEVGYISQLGFTAQALYGAFDVQIQSDKYNGTFLMQGVFDLQVPVRTLAVVGGTGDFYLARGYATFTTAATNATPKKPGDIVTYLYDAHFKY